MALVSFEQLYRNALLSRAAYVEVNGRDVTATNGAWQQQAFGDPAAVQAMGISVQAGQDFYGLRDYGDYGDSA